MKSNMLINTLIIFFILLILYNFTFKIREGLTSNQQKINDKIKSLEKDIASLRSVNPLMPCAPIYPVVKDNTEKIKSMKDTISDLKANCSRQNA